ncbi:MAG: hypothetical protein LUG56_04270 [Lachnospiraceae bacterium]|nr:hypothetical protein [Lachnospiraceae bacterium]MCD7841664.1 hypothetical protein [Lachnospiraceae bacterium]
MKFKPFYRGMVIHCLYEKDIRTLIKRFEELNYIWSSGDYIHERDAEDIIGKYEFFIIRSGYSVEPGTARDVMRLKITEFSEVAQYELTAIDFINWLSTHDGDAVMDKLFGMKDAKDVLKTFDGTEIVRRISAYETSTETETYSCYQIKMTCSGYITVWADSEQAALNIARKMPASAVDWDETPDVEIIAAD